MKKLLIIMLSIMGASQAIVLNAASCELEENRISLLNDTSQMLYVGVYQLDSKTGIAQRCFDVTPRYSMNPGFRIPEREGGRREIRVPKKNGWIFFSTNELSDSITADNIKKLEDAGFKGFKVGISSFRSNNYKISQDKTGKKFTGGKE